MKLRSEEKTIRKQVLNNPLMKFGLVITFIGLFPALFPSLMAVPGFDIIQKLCLVLGIVCMLTVMFKKRR